MVWDRDALSANPMAPVHFVNRTLISDPLQICECSLGNLRQCLGTEDGGLIRGAGQRPSQAHTRDYVKDESDQAMTNGESDHRNSAHDHDLWSPL